MARVGGGDEDMKVFFRFFLVQSMKELMEGARAYYADVALPKLVLLYPTPYHTGDVVSVSPF